MKRKIVNMLGVALSILLLGGCSSSEDSANDNASQATRQLTVSVNQEGFTTSDSTRTSNSGTTTTFVQNDAIGVYVVDASGNVKVTNQKMIYNGSTWTSDGTTAATITAGTNYKFFAYYPYSSSNPVTGTTTTATTAADFFSSYISSWNTGTDFSTAAKYDAKDLMVADGDASGTQCQFTMKHQMALVEVDFPQVIYYDNNANKQQKYTFTSHTPYNIADGKYRILVNPNSGTTAINGNKYSSITATATTWSISITNTTLNRAHIKYYKTKSSGSYVDASLTKNCTGLAVGCVFYSDGTYSSALATGKTPVGVVVSTTADCCERTSGYGHGLVMALQNANAGSIWCIDKDAGDAEGLTNVTNKTTFTSDKSGLANTKLIVNTSGYDAETYPAFYQAVNYSVTAPEGTSGWFLASTGQWYETLTQAQTFYNTKNTTKQLAIPYNTWEFPNSPTNNYADNCVTEMDYLIRTIVGESASISILPISSDYYWTSSENSSTHACYISLQQQGDLRWNEQTKSIQGIIRPFLAF